MTAPSPPWSPHVYRDRQPFLRGRAAIRDALRRRFGLDGFVEVETPILQRSPGNEEHLEAFATRLVSPRGHASLLYLHTSPEFGMKKLLAAGETRLFSLGKVFRNGERTATHHPEFTMLEWYRAGESYDVLVADCAAILRVAADAAGSSTWTFRGRSCDPRRDPERLSVAAAFLRFADIDLLSTLSPSEDRAALARQADRVGIAFGETDTWSDIFSRVLVERVEPRLGLGRPTILDRYPAPEAALARRSPEDPLVAERFELYCCGVELANCFGELTDVPEQRRRFEAAMAARRDRGAEAYPVDEDFLDALGAMPQASGGALGFDRLAMLATGAQRIEQVMWLPVYDPDAR